MYKQILFSAAVALAALPNLAVAQHVVYPTYGDGLAVVRSAPHHASTVAEGYLRGLGAAYEGYGAGARDYAQAQLIAEQAKGLELQNTAAKREAKRSARQQYEAASTAASNQRRARHVSERLARSSKPKVAAPPAILADGRINWPVELSGEEFTDLRSAMDELVESGALAKSKQATGAAAELADLGGQLCSTVALSVRQNQLPPRALLAARQLVNRLATQAAASRDVKIASVQKD